MTIATTASSRPKSKTVTRAALDASVTAALPGSAPSGAGQQAATSQLGELRFVRQGQIDARVRGAAGDSSTDNSALFAALAAEAKPLGAEVFIPDGKYVVDGIELSFDGDTPNPSTYGFRGVPISGNGSRGTILVHKPGSTKPLVKLSGSPSASDLSHTGKLTGVSLSGMELRGQGKSSGNPAPGVEVSIYEFGHISDLFITEFGGSGMSLRRPVRSAIRDDHSHMLEIESVKVFRNGSDGVVTPDDHAVGPITLVNVESSYNGGRGYELIPAGVQLYGCSSYANALGGVRTRASQNGSLSTGQGFQAYGSRFEGDMGPEVDFDGSDHPMLVGCTILATDASGPDCVRIGISNQVLSALIIGGELGGNGGSTGTAGQRAIRIGGNARGTTVINPQVRMDRFADGYTQTAVPMLVIANSGSFSMILIDGAWRVATSEVGSSSSNVASQVRLNAEGQPRYQQLVSGAMSWGGGSAALDTTLYRNAADQLKTDDKLLAALGIGVGNSASASSLGTLAKKMEVFDATGASLGFVPIYTSIT